MPAAPEGRHHPWGEDGRVDPDSLAPDDEERAAGPEGPTADLVLRGLSVVPFLLLAALGLIGIVSWVLIIVLGVGSAEPIWRAAEGMSAADLAVQLLLVALIAAACVALVLAGSWATAHGFRPSSGRTFWTIAQALWAVAAVGLVVLDRAFHPWLDDAGVETLDWWFAFGVVAFAMIVAGVRLRRAPRTRWR